MNNKEGSFKTQDKIKFSVNGYIRMKKDYLVDNEYMCFNLDKRLM